MARGDVAEQLLGPDGFRLEEWQQASRLDIVKSGPHRTVYRARLDSGCYYLKHYRVGDWKAVLRNIVRSPRALLEWQAARRVAAAGVETFDTLAVGCTRRNRVVLDSFLASRAIDDSVSLDAFALQQLPRLPAARRHTIRRNLAATLGRLAAALHRARLIHRDLHAENVLVRLEADDSVRLWLIDLHAVDVCRRLSLRHIERNLVLLNPALTHHLTAHDRVRFFRSYWQALLADDTSAARPPGHLITADRRAVSSRLAEFCRRDLIRTERKRDRKWARGNRRLIIADTHGMRCRGIAALGSEQLQAIRDDPAVLLEQKRVLLSGDENPVDCRVRPGSRLPLGLRQRLLGELSDVRRAWEMGHACLRRNLPTPRPIAFVEQTHGASPRRFLVTEDIPQAVSLADWLRDHPFNVRASGPNGRLERIAVCLAGELRRLHDAGLDHQRLGAESILVAYRNSDCRIWFVALEHVRQHRRLGPQRIVAALARLNSALPAGAGGQLTQRLRFLKHYLNEQFARQWKAVWRGVARQTQPARPAAGNRQPTAGDEQTGHRTFLSRSA